MYPILTATISAIMILNGCNDKPVTTPPEANAPDPNEQTQIAIGLEMQGRIWVTSNGTNYTVLSVGQLYFADDNQRMLTVRFLSKDPHDKAVREVEFNDIYVLVARNFDLTGYHLVGLEAADKPPVSFGVQKVSGYRDNKTVEQVKELAKQAMIPPNPNTAQ